jgi:hypothetical protein
VLSRTGVCSDVAAARRHNNRDTSDADFTKQVGLDMMAVLDLMTNHLMLSSSFRLYKLPRGAFGTLKCCRQEFRGRALVVVGFHGDEHSSWQYAYEALQLEQHGTTGIARGMTTARPKIPATSTPPLLDGALESGGDKEGELLIPECFALNQYSDWYNRGDHFIVKHMSLYLYSMWVSRVDLRVVTLALKCIHIPFDKGYAAPNTWVQRILVDPCVPRLEGFQSMINSEAEIYYMCKLVLLRPISVAVEDDSEDSPELSTLKAISELCKAPEGEAPAPGPVQRSWESFYAQQMDLVYSGRHKCIRYPHLWKTVPVDNPRQNLSSIYGIRVPETNQEDTSGCLTIEEYFALETVRASRKFDDLARQHSEIQIPHTEMHQQEGGGDGASEGNRLRLGFFRGENYRIVPRFDNDSLASILSFRTFCRTSTFIKDLEQTNFMQTGELPQPYPTAALQQRIEDLRVSLVGPYTGLDNIRDGLDDIACLQRRAFARGGFMDYNVSADEYMPLASEEEGLVPSQEPLVLCGGAAQYGRDVVIRNFPQPAMRLFKSFLVKEPKLLALMAFMRDPCEKIPPEIIASWNSIQLKDSDPRLQEERFQNGHMIAIHWETVSRWIIMRTKRDAKALRTPLYIVQSANSSTPQMPQVNVGYLMNMANPRSTGGMHGMLPIHLGMKIRILKPHVLGNGLGKDTEGEVVNIVINPLDQEEVDADIASEADTIYLRHLPLGVWIRMAKYTRAPFCKALRQLDDSLLPCDTQSLVWMELRTSHPFPFRGHTVVRTGFSFTHGRVIPSTACHGRTLPEGVIIDCAHAEHPYGITTNDDRWVEVYEMLSCASRLEDVLLMRAPPCSFLLQGPPNVTPLQFRAVSRLAAARSSFGRQF